MPNPTLEDDIATVRACITTTGYPLEALAALNRLAKAVGERGHLEEGARLLIEMASVTLAVDEEADVFRNERETRKWLDRERARKRGEPVLKSEP